MRMLNVALGLLASTKLLGVIVFVVYAIGQSVLLLSLEILVAIAQHTQLYPNPKITKNRDKLIEVFSGAVFIFMGFILAYFGFSYGF